MADETNASKILIIDDDKFLLDMYSTKFSNEGFEVSTFLGGRDALIMIQEGSVVPDIVLVDLVMPSVDGFDLIENIRAKDTYANTLIVVLSNLGESEDIERAKKLGADNYIIKANVTPSEVVEKVRSILDEKK